MLILQHYLSEALIWIMIYSKLLLWPLISLRGWGRTFGNKAEATVRGPLFSAGQKSLIHLPPVTSPAVKQIHNIQVHDNIEVYTQKWKSQIQIASFSRDSHEPKNQTRTSACDAPFCISNS